MNYELVTLEEVLESLPHKFQNGKNVKIIFEAYLKQYNKIFTSYIQSNMMYNINNAVGDQLDRIGRNFLVSRGSQTDEEYRNSIKLTWAVLKSSGNVYNLSKIFLEYLGLDKDVINIKELDNAKIILELNRNNSASSIVSSINEIMKFVKPVGVGFSVEPFTNIAIIDTYSEMQLETLIDRWKNQFMDDNEFMKNELHLWDTYYMNISVDKYSEVEIERL